jgi:hypothetical protein
VKELSIARSKTGPSCAVTRTSRCNHFSVDIAITSFPILHYTSTPLSLGSYSYQLYHQTYHLNFNERQQSPTNHSLNSRHNVRTPHATLTTPPPPLRDQIDDLRTPTLPLHNSTNRKQYICCEPPSELPYILYLRHGIRRIYSYCTHHRSISGRTQ